MTVKAFEEKVIINLCMCKFSVTSPKIKVLSRELEVLFDRTVFHEKNLILQVVKKSLNMVEPDVEIEGRGVILISSEAGETADNEEKTLAHFNLVDGSILVCDDFLQEYKLRVFLYHGYEIRSAQWFCVCIGMHL